MNGRRKTKSLCALAAFLLLVLPVGAAFALVITSSTLNLSSISITPSSGTVSIEPWTAEASAAANNSLGQSAGQFDSSIVRAVADARVTWAEGHGEANALLVTANGSTVINLPGFLNQAEASGRGSLFTFFMIAGGTGDVGVTFSMNLDASQNGFADAVGIFRNEIAASLEVDGEVVLFRNSIIAGGPNFADSRMIDTTLSETRTLLFGLPYFLFIEADSEALAINLPEPSALVLVLAGLGLLACYSFRSRRITRT